MSSFELSREHEEFRRSVREFAEAEITPHAQAWDRDHHFPVDVVQKMGKLGLFGLTAPGEYGGADGDFTSLCVAIEEVSRADQSMGITLEAAVGLLRGWRVKILDGKHLDGTERRLKETRALNSAPLPAALLTYNVISVVKGSLCAAHGDRAELQRLSTYCLAEEIGAAYWGMMIAIPPSAWRRAFGDLSSKQMADHLKELASHTRIQQFQKHQRKTRNPPPRPPSGSEMSQKSLA